ncbi:WD40 repeat domain-containing protein [Nocardia sp. NPDC051570]|uniref:WD40 repeat domain-containing protein n=1 Tax=Nocardia sp. NPDC051570 TaxID=3364324 RepID=UPI0037BDDCED
MREPPATEIRAEDRGAFVLRLAELFAAAGSPPVKSVVRAANDRLRDGGTRITAQRISDWRRGNRTPATFVSVLPVLETLIAAARRRAADDPRIDTSLFDLRRWHRDWTAAKTEPGVLDAHREPYRGLWAYGVEDSDLFFGRAAAKRRLLELISATESSAAPSLVLLLGGSGLGKSSLLAAGMQADPGARTPIVLTPGDDPVAALESALSGAPEGRRLLLVDQAEELFDRCANEPLRQRFLAELAGLAAPGATTPTTVVLAFDTARLPELLRYPLLMTALRDRSMLLEPMTDEELREAIVKPAVATGLRVEDGLVEVLLRDLAAVDAQSAVRLPLLSFALAETWANRRGKTLTPEAYRAGGGMSGASAHGGEVFWAGLDDDQREAARHVLVALTITGPTTVVRNRMPVELLVEESAEPEVTRGVIARLTELRMIVRHNDGIELVHDLLLTGWPRLAGWLAEEKEFAPTRQRIEADAREWSRQDRPATLLYTRTRLEDAAAWLGRTGSANRLSREFVSASLVRERKHVIRRRTTLSVIAALIVVALALSGVVVAQRSAVAQQRRDVQLGQLIAESQRVEDLDPDLSVRLALAAYRMDPGNPTARARLLAAQTLPLVVASRGAAHTGMVRTLAFSSRLNLLASAGDDGRIGLWNMFDPRAITPVGPQLDGHRGRVTALAFAPDGTTLISGGADGTVRLWDIRDPRAAHEAGILDTGTVVTAMVCMPDGRTVVAAGADGTLSFLNIEVPQHIQRRGTPIAAHAGEIRALSLAPDAPMLATAGDDRGVRLWRVDDVEHPAPVGAPLESRGAPTAVDLGNAGRLAIGTASGELQVWNVAGGEPPRLIASQTVRRVPIARLRFWQGGLVLLAADTDGSGRIWNTASGDHISRTGWEIRVSDGGRIGSFVLMGPDRMAVAGYGGLIRVLTFPLAFTSVNLSDSLSSIGFDRAGRVLATGGRGGQVELWNTGISKLSVPMTEFAAGPPDPDGVLIAMRPDGKLLATADHGEVRLWNLTDPRQPTPVAALPATGLGSPIAFSPNGNQLITGAGPGALVLWDVSDPATPHAQRQLRTGDDRPIRVVTFRPDSALLAAGGDTSRIHLWDMSTRDEQPTATIDPGDSDVRALLFAPDGTRLFSAHGSGMLRSWNVTDPVHARALDAVRAHSLPVKALAIADSGHRLATGGDGAVRLWDITDPAALRPIDAPLAAPIGWTWFLRFVPNDDSRLFGIGDRISALWYTDADAVATHICAAIPVDNERAWPRLLPIATDLRPCR